MIRDTLNERPSRKRNDGLIRFIAEKKLKKIERAREIKDGDPWEVLKTANQSEMVSGLLLFLYVDQFFNTQRYVIWFKCLRPFHVVKYYFVTSRSNFWWHP